MQPTKIRRGKIRKDNKKEHHTEHLTAFIASCCFTWGYYTTNPTSEGRFSISQYQLAQFNISMILNLLRYLFRLREYTQYDRLPLVVYIYWAWVNSLSKILQVYTPKSPWKARKTAKDMFRPSFWKGSSRLRRNAWFNKFIITRNMQGTFVINADARRHYTNEKITIWLAQKVQSINFACFDYLHV